MLVRELVVLATIAIVCGALLSIVLRIVRRDPTEKALDDMIRRKKDQRP